MWRARLHAQAGVAVAREAHSHRLLLAKRAGLWRLRAKRIDTKPDTINMNANGIWLCKTFKRFA